MINLSYVAMQFRLATQGQEHSSGGNRRLGGEFYVTDHSPKIHIEGQAAVRASSTPLPEVPFPAEYTGGPAREAGGQQEATDGRMTYKQCEAALQKAEGLVDKAYSACLQSIAAFEKYGPFLVDKAQERLRDYCFSENRHEEDLVKQAQQVEAEIERWLPHTGEFAPLLASVSATMNSTVTELMDGTIKQIQALPSHTTATTDIADIVAVVDQIRKALKSMDDGDANAGAKLPTARELDDAAGKIDNIKMDQAKAEDFLSTMAQCGFLAGAQVAATFQAIAGYIETRNAYLMTYIKATDYFRESGDTKEHVALRDGAIQAAYGAITTAVGQYAPLILPSVFAQVPLIGGGFAILDVARTMNEKRKLVKERENHLLKLAKAHVERGFTDENFWLKARLRDDRAALDELVRATIEMCRGLRTLADPLKRIR
jgi:hypothetical protein